MGDDGGTDEVIGKTHAVPFFRFEFSAWDLVLHRGPPVAASPVRKGAALRPFAGWACRPHCGHDANPRCVAAQILASGDLLP